MGTLVELLKNTAVQLPKQTALIFGENRIDYGLLLEASKRLAGGLSALGIQKGDRVALMLPNVPHFCISYFGILEIGGIVVPVNIMSSREEIQHQLKDSGASAMITWSGFQNLAIVLKEMCPECKNILFLGDNIPTGTLALTRVISESQPLETEIEINETDIAVINYTTGIADVPLGAELTHSSLYSNAITCSEMFRFTPEDKMLAVLPLFHPLGQTLVMNSSFSRGCSVALMPRYSPDEIIQTVNSHKITFMAAVPGIFTNLIEDTQEAQLPSLKYCMNYGGKLPQEVIDVFEEKYHAVILQAYGLTEAGPLVTSVRLDSDRKANSVGLPLMGVEIQIRDDRGNQLRPFQSGEIWTKSQNIMNGYYNKPEETRKRLQNGWLFTGDVGYIDDNHYLYVQERKENIIVKGGFIIFPHEVEKVLLEHADVMEAAVIDVPDDVQGSEVKAYVVLKDGKNLMPDELIKFCRHTLPVYKTPKYIEFCASIPKSPTGRVLKRVLRKNSIHYRSGNEDKKFKENKV